jgi:hypothetical protein
MVPRVLNMADSWPMSKEKNSVKSSGMQYFKEGKWIL